MTMGKTLPAKSVSSQGERMIDDGWRLEDVLANDDRVQRIVSHFGNLLGNTPVFALFFCGHST